MLTKTGPLVFIAIVGAWLVVLAWPGGDGAPITPAASEPPTSTATRAPGDARVASPTAAAAETAPPSPSATAASDGATAEATPTPATTASWTAPTSPPAVPTPTPPPAEVAQPTPAGFTPEQLAVLEGKLDANMRAYATALQQRDLAQVKSLLAQACQGVDVASFVEQQRARLSAEIGVPIDQAVVDAPYVLHMDPEYNYAHAAFGFDIGGKRVLERSLEEWDYEGGAWHDRECR